MSYDRKYLTDFPSDSEAVVFQIEQIASGPCPSTVELALLLNATEGPKLSFATVVQVGDQVVLKDGIQLPNSPLLITIGTSWEVCAAPAQSSCRSMLLVWKATSEESGGICDMDIRAMQAMAAYRLHTRHLVVLEGHPRGQA